MKFYSYVTPLKHIDSRKIIGVVKIDVGEKTLQGILDTLQGSEDVGLMLLQRGKVFAKSSQLEEITEIEGNQVIAGDRMYQTVTKAVPGTELEIVYLYSRPSIYKDFVIYPLCKGIFLSFTNWNGYSQTYKMSGVANYVRMLTDSNVHRAFTNTIIYGVGSTILQNVLGLALALFLNQKFRGRAAVRTIVYLPVMIAPLIMGYIMYFFFSFHNGALNDVIAIFGREAVDWLANGNRGVVILTIVNSLQFVGISMVIYLAGLQGISDMYYEAAAIDGVKESQKFWHITLPLLMPAINSSVTINLIGGLKLFDIIMALTSGGPGYDTHSLSTLVNRTYFGSENAGYASAIGLVSFALIMVLSNIVVKIMEKKEVDL